MTSVWFKLPLLTFSWYPFSRFFKWAIFNNCFCLAIFVVVSFAFFCKSPNIISFKYIAETVLYKLAFFIVFDNPSNLSNLVVKNLLFLNRDSSTSVKWPSIIFLSICLTFVAWLRNVLGLSSNFILGVLLVGLVSCTESFDSSLTVSMKSSSTVSSVSSMLTFLCQTIYF